MVSHSNLSNKARAWVFMRIAGYESTRVNEKERINFYNVVWLDLLNTDAVSMYLCAAKVAIVTKAYIYCKEVAPTIDRNNAQAINYKLLYF